eukprot:Skav225957  [mRNA]  locus=scaffold6030:17704:19515:- [translate_table: standard]
MLRPNRLLAPVLLEAYDDSIDDSKETVELLRFVTPYKMLGGELDEVDETAQPVPDMICNNSGWSLVPRLMKSLMASGPLEFYVAIDTWDSNDTRSKILYISNVSAARFHSVEFHLGVDTCTPFWTSSGNAWNVSLELVQWPRVFDAEPVQQLGEIGGAVEGWGAAGSSGWLVVAVGVGRWWCGWVHREDGVITMDGG